jgi:uncharacterized membrane protein YhaH (DUF805 family)
MSFLRLCFGFSGRMNRSEYATMYFGSILALIAAIALAIGLLNILGDGADSAAIGVSLLVFIIACKWVALGALVKRLHDVEAPGVLCLLAIIPALGFGFFLLMLFVPGTKGGNHYGAPTSLFGPRISYAGA